MTHPSFYALDLLHLGVGDAAHRAHLAQCHACSAYLGRLEQPVGVPADLRARVRSRFAWPWFAPLGLATAGVLVAVIAMQGGSTEVRSKGQPTVSVFLKRGERVMLWNGVEPVQPRDSLRLEVRPEGLPHLRVLSGTETLFEGMLASPKEALPVGWRVDDHGLDIELGLVFSKSALSESVAREAWRAQTRSEDVWATSLVLRAAGQ